MFKKLFLLAFSFVFCIGLAMPTFALDDNVIVSVLTQKIEDLIDERPDVTKEKMTKTLKVVSLNMEEQGRDDLVSILDLVLDNISGIQKQADKTDLFEKEQSYFPHKESEYAYSRKMEKPALSDMSNRDAIQNGFEDERTKTYTFTAQEEKLFSQEHTQKSCKKGVSIIADDKEVSKISLSDVQEGEQITLEGKYDGQGYRGQTIDLSQPEKSFFADHGWTIHDPQRSLTSYQGEGNDLVMHFEEEWTSFYDTIGGQDQEYRRFPYNTILITSDLLLHSYFKILEGQLKYYEQATARKNMQQLSAQSFDYFVTKANNTSDEQLRKYYEFLAAYWAIPSAMFVDETTLLGLENPGEMQDAVDPSDQEIERLVKAALQEKLAQVDTKYHEALTSTLHDIFEAKKSKGQYYLMEIFGDEFNADPTITLEQDYTQFVPRSHYRTNALLKTYFMGMKYLMRTKFFYQDEAHTTASLILINNMQAQDKFDELYNFVKKIVGSDDDVNVYDVQDFLDEKHWDNDRDILAGMSEEVRRELQTMKPQLIMGTHFSSPSNGATTEAEAKNTSAGFVLFGEKFTLDSWLYDSLTAGKPEKEYAFKPSIATVLSVPATIGDNALAEELVDIRLESKKNDKRLNEGQQKGYPEVAEQMKELLYTYDFTQNVYHRRIDILNYLFVSQDDNAPYFLADPLYAYKQLNTYLGSYTELKHATLLYVKQAYAELGGGLQGCEIVVDPPSLPVPKGYVEPNIELIDQLIKLSEHTSQYFGEKGAEKFGAYKQYLEFVKTIAISQLDNKKIADTEFEQLRLYDQQLNHALRPDPYFGQALQKEQRASIIADIFNSGEQGQLYEAVGRPQLLLMMIDDANGQRIVLGPVYTHYEFYTNEDIGIESEKGRYVDHEWQMGYDDNFSTIQKVMSLPIQELRNKME